VHHSRPRDVDLTIIGSRYWYKYRWLAIGYLRIGLEIPRVFHGLSYRFNKTLLIIRPTIADRIA
jgi:hypothetical protein